ELAREGHAQHDHTAEGVPDRHDLTLCLPLNMLDELRGVVDELRPVVQVAALSVALAVAPQVHCVGRHPESGHAVGESLISAAVLAESVDHRKSDVRCSRVPGPCADGGI